MAGEIESVLQEKRQFPPPPAFSSRARVKSLDEYRALAGRAERDPEGFWSEIAGELHWFTPWSTDPADLAEQTLRVQGATSYDFAAGMRVALRDYAPDVVLLAGPGGSLGGACAQIVVMERYRGISTRGEFEAAQGGPNAILLSLRR